MHSIRSTFGISKIHGVYMARMEPLKFVCQNGSFPQNIPICKPSNAAFSCCSFMQLKHLQKNKTRKISGCVELQRRWSKDESREECVEQKMAASVGHPGSQERCSLLDARRIAFHASCPFLITACECVKYIGAPVKPCHPE